MFVFYFVYDQSTYWSKFITVNSIYQAKMSNMLCFWQLKCEDLLLFVCFYVIVNWILLGFELMAKWTNQLFKDTILGLRNLWWAFFTVFTVFWQCTDKMINLINKKIIQQCPSQVLSEIDLFQNDCYPENINDCLHTSHFHHQISTLDIFYRKKK